MRPHSVESAFPLVFVSVLILISCLFVNSSVMVEEIQSGAKPAPGSEIRSFSMETVQVLRAGNTHVQTTSGLMGGPQGWKGGPSLPPWQDPASSTPELSRDPPG